MELKKLQDKLIWKHLDLMKIDMERQLLISRVDDLYNRFMPKISSNFDDHFVMLCGDCLSPLKYQKNGFYEGYYACTYASCVPDHDNIYSIKVLSRKDYEFLFKK